MGSGNSAREALRRKQHPAPIRRIQRPLPWQSLRSTFRLLPPSFWPTTDDNQLTTNDNRPTTARSADRHPTTALISTSPAPSSGHPPVPLPSAKTAPRTQRRQASRKSAPSPPRDCESLSGQGRDLSLHPDPKTASCTPSGTGTGP